MQVFKICAKSKFLQFPNNKKSLKSRCDFSKPFLNDAYTINVILTMYRSYAGGIRQYRFYKHCFYYQSTSYATRDCRCFMSIYDFSKVAIIRNILPVHKYLPYNYHNFTVHYNMFGVLRIQ